MSQPLGSRALLVLAASASLVLLALRWYAAGQIGFGDAEALYASYALYPQPVYLDHPGLVGVLARAIGGGRMPSPEAAHRVTAVLATLVPWLAALAARALGASSRGALLAALALLVTPEIAIGLFGMTPDLLLIVCWYGALALAATALAAPPASGRATFATLLAGFVVGLAFDAKATGALLGVGLVLAWASPRSRSHLRTFAPWGGLAIALLVASPVLIDEVARGFPMLRHRLVATQRGAGPSVRNAAALFFGQLAYLTPPLLFAAWRVFRDLYARRRDDGGAALLFATTLAATPLILLSLWSRVAEPHWVAPLYLALPLHLARRGGAPLGRRLARASVVTGAAVIAFAHAWVLLPLGPRLLGPRYEARYDLANDLFAWRVGMPLVERAIAEVAPGQAPPIVIGPHWTICAQLRAGLPASTLVGCDSNDVGDDFATWVPRERWLRAPVIVYVTDDRFASAPAPSLWQLRIEKVARAEVERGGRIVRTIRTTTLVRVTSAAR